MVRRTVATFVIVVTISLVSLNRYADAAKNKHKLFFVASNHELRLDANKACTVQGLGISANYYLQASKARQDKLKTLAKHVFECKNRPVFVYGNPPARHTLIQEILGYNVGSTEGAFIGYIERPDNNSGLDDFYRTIVGLPNSELKATEMRMRQLVEWVYNEASKRR